MRAYEFLCEGLSNIRDKAFNRFWWTIDGFEWIEEPHADYVVSYLSDIASGDYDDEINELGDTEEEVNEYFMQSRNAVRGGVHSNLAYLDSNKLRNIHRCLLDLISDYPKVNEVTVDCPQFRGTLTGDALQYFIGRGRIERPRF